MTMTSPSNTEVLEAVELFGTGRADFSELVDRVWDRTPVASESTDVHTLVRKRHGYPRWRRGRERAVSVSRPAAEPPILHDVDVRAVRAQLQGDY